ncbi:hypothetical protein X551_01270 [Methylibium sp. T29]|nr:hypothetical protein X551_01270 [Methylibium sp. T29]
MHHPHLDRIGARYRLGAAATVRQDVVGQLVVVGRQQRRLRGRGPHRQCRSGAAPLRWLLRQPAGAARGQQLEVGLEAFAVVGQRAVLAGRVPGALGRQRRVPRHRAVAAVAGQEVDAAAGGDHRLALAEHGLPGILRRSHLEHRAAGAGHVEHRRVFTQRLEAVLERAAAHEVTRGLQHLRVGQLGAMLGLGDALPAGGIEQVAEGRVAVVRQHLQQTGEAGAEARHVAVGHLARQHREHRGQPVLTQQQHRRRVGTLVRRAQHHQAAAALLEVLPQRLAGDVDIERLARHQAAHRMHQQVHWHRAIVQPLDDGAQLLAQARAAVLDRQPPVEWHRDDAKARVRLIQQALVAGRQQAPGAQCAAVGTRVGILERQPLQRSVEHRAEREPDAITAVAALQLAAHDAGQHQQDRLAGVLAQPEIGQPGLEWPPAQRVGLQRLQRAARAALVVRQRGEAVVASGQRAEQRTARQAAGTEVGEVRDGGPLAAQAAWRLRAALQAAEHRARVDHEVVVVQAVEHVAEQRDDAAPALAARIAGDHAQAVGRLRAAAGQRQRQRRAGDHRFQPGHDARIGAGCDQ